MTEKVTDEMLMAFADGETDAATHALVARAVLADPALARKVEEFRGSRRLMREAFGGVRDEPVPEALVRAALSRADDKVVPLRRRFEARYALPIAASLALVFGAAGYLAGSAGTPASDPLGRAALAAALGETKSGESRVVTFGGDEAQLRTLATYRTADGLCRSFDLSGATIALSGVGCDAGGGWSLDLVVAGASGEGYAPASGAALQSIDAYLDAVEASEALSDEEENALSGD